jgi:tetratricopeptide (TPR) repeat protein
MQSIVSTANALTQHFTTAVDELCEIARTYLFDGRLEDAKAVCRHSLHLIETNEVTSHDRLKLLLQYAWILATDRFVARSSIDLVTSVLSEAKQIAEATHDQHGLADALSLLGQAHYFDVVVNISTRNIPPGKLDEALAYQQQAFKIRQALNDTRGISESHFWIGVIHERLQQNDIALEHYTKARQIADQYEHHYERTEPSRHLSFQALYKGDLDQALDYALQALRFREEAGFKPFLPLDHLSLSNIYLTKGDTKNALLHAQRGFALAEEIGYKGALVFSLLSFGDIHVAQKEEAQARINYEKALTLAHELQSALLIAMANERLERLEKQ